MEAYWEVTSMANSEAATLYRYLTPRQALAVLAFLGLALAWCLAASGGEPWTRAGKRGGDVALFESVEKRIRGGESYYTAMGSELRSRGYQTRSVLNWRTPLHLSLLARLPSQWGWFLLLAFTIAAVAMGFVAMCRDGRHVPTMVLVLCMLASFGSFMPGATLYSEVWAGALIAGSVGAYYLHRWYAGAALAILALLFRELALGYFLVCVLLAYRDKRRPELVVLLAGLCGYATYYAFHAAAVLPLITAADIGAKWSELWIRFGGVRFLLTASRQGMMLAAPLWLTALYLPIALFGLAGWTQPIATRLRLTVGMYLLTFAVLGRPVQFYWGMLYNPLLSFGAALAVVAFRDLLLALGSQAGKSKEGQPVTG
jgi:hypothetical protein